MYREKINESIEKVYQAGVATKILQYMNKIRNESDITQARRWVMELLQNARDLAWEDKPLKVQIELRDDALIFRHSGKPFRVKDILSIVNQVSSKNPGEGVGQFGTGFMTTYQLSERVEIHSILKDDGFPGKEFRVTLDRTGHSKEEILQAIFHNLDELQEADELPDIAEHDYGTDYDTEFRYLLESSHSKDIARTGVTDLADTILYVMLFSEGIGSVEISISTAEKQDTITYRRGGCITRSGALKELTVMEERSGGVQIPHTLFFMQDQGMTLAAEYDPEQGFLPVSERTPRIFVDFPLIGAERFPFPVVINDLRFHPNEPRSGISLVDNPDSAEAAENKALMESAVRNYEVFMQELVQTDIRGAAYLISTFMWQDNKEWSEEWVKKNLYDSIYKIIERLPIFPVPEGKMSLADDNFYIIRSSSQAEKEGIKKLTASLPGYTVPDDDTDWYNVLRPYHISDSKVIHLKKLLQNASGFMSTFEDPSAAVEWNHLLYETAMNVAETATEIQAGNIAIFPSQSPEDRKSHKLYTIRQIYRDPDIPEILKDAAELLNILDDPIGQSGHYTLRRKLLPCEFGLIDENSIPQYELSSLAEYIQTHCSCSYKTPDYYTFKSSIDEARQNALNMLISCGPDDEIYELCSVWYGETFPERKKLEDDRFNAALWRNAYFFVLRQMIIKIQNLSMLSELDIDSPYKWLNIFYKKCSALFRGDELVIYKIYPDQEGNLSKLTSLSADAVKEEELKEIAVCFSTKDPGCNMYKELLDRNVILDGWSISKRDDRDAAQRINNVVQKLLMESSLSHTELIYQEACTRLLSWIEEHPELAPEYFPAFYKEEDRMKLLTPKAAVSMQKKAHNYEKLVEMLGTNDSEKIGELVRKLKQVSENNYLSDGDYYNEDSDIWMDSELMSLDLYERDRICREIGNAGEQYAFELVCQELLDRGCQLVEEEVGLVRFAGENEEYTVHRPDMAGHHQAGWDIKVTCSFSQDDEDTPPKAASWYLEVKTHTPGSVRKGILRISNEQMKLAASHGENYFLLSITYNYKKKQVTGLNTYKDPCRQLASGKLANASDCYLLLEKVLV